MNFYFQFASILVQVISSVSKIFLLFFLWIKFPVIWKMEFSKQNFDGRLLYHVLIFVKNKNRNSYTFSDKIDIFFKVSN